MRFLGKFAIGIFTGFICFLALSFARNGLLDHGSLLFWSFIGPCLLPFGFLFLPSPRKALGAAFIAIGLSFATMPIGLFSAVDDIQTDIAAAETQSVTEGIVKSIVVDGVSKLFGGLLLFGPLIGLIFVPMGIVIWRAKTLSQKDKVMSPA